MTALLEAKQSGGEVAQVPEAPDDGAAVVDLMSALRRSVERARGGADDSAENSEDEAPKKAATRKAAPKKAAAEDEAPAKKAPAKKAAAKKAAAPAKKTADAGDKPPAKRARRSA